MVCVWARLWNRVIQTLCRQSHFSFKRTPGVTPKQERLSQQGVPETSSSPLSSYPRNWPSRSIGEDADRSISQQSPRFSLNTSGSSSSLPRRFDTSRLGSALSVRRSLSPTREGDGSRLPRIPEDPSLNPSARRFVVKEEMPSPDIAAASRFSHGGPGKPSDREGGTGFRCESVPRLDAYIGLIWSGIVSAATPSFSRLSQSASFNPDVRWGSREPQRSPSRHSSRDLAVTSGLDLTTVASKFATDMKNAQVEIEELVCHTQLQCGKLGLP